MAPAQPPPPPLQRAWLQQAQVPGGMGGSVTAVLVRHKLQRDNVIGFL